MSSCAPTTCGCTGTRATRWSRSRGAAIGEYADEVGEELNVRVGQGITGWVAQQGLPQYLPDAAHDPRAETMPGTDPDLDESMLLAPMRFDDRTVGVIVLSRLGIDQFEPDELRYLKTYAAMAAQAMANVDATELLRAQSEILARQLEAQRQLLRATESILSTLDPHGIVEEIAQRVGTLFPVDTIDPATPAIPRAGRRVSSSPRAKAPRCPDSESSDVIEMSAWLERHGTVLRLQHDAPPPEDLRLERAWDDDALAVAPLLGAGEIMGALAVTRRGDRATFDDAELELIQLFAGHVAIALRNAVQHQAVELRAQTDALTGLENQGTFNDRLDRWVASNRPFSLLLVDMDGFKSFNDEHGHAAGNQLLREVGATFVRACRDSDEIYRYGGDEFADRSCRAARPPARSRWLRGSGVPCASSARPRPAAWASRAPWGSHRGPRMPPTATASCWRPTGPATRPRQLDATVPRLSRISPTRPCSSSGQGDVRSHAAVGAGSAGSDPALGVEAADPLPAACPGLAMGLPTAPAPAMARARASRARTPGPCPAPWRAGAARGR